MARWRLRVAGFVAIVLLTPVAAPVGVVGQDEPIFHLPFPCGETWVASTRADHVPSIDAVDLNLPDGAPDAGRVVLAGADGGTVADVGDPGEDNDGLGEFVDVAYGPVELRFAQLQETSSLAVGDPVDAQTVIGRVGATGAAEGEHLHYEQRVGGVPRPVVIEGVTWAIGTDIADDAGDLARRPGIAHLSENCGTASTAPAVQWIEPATGVEVGATLHLAAWPTPVLGTDGLVDDTATAGVDFRAVWPGGGAPLCSATTADTAGLWACDADLAALGVPAGSLELAFDVRRGDGSTLTAPDGVAAVTYPGGAPTVRWAAGTPGGGRHIPFGEPVALVARVSDDVDLSEVRFTAWYPDWARSRDAQRLPDFDAARTPRTLAVCRPRGAESTRGCRWEGDRRDAVVTFRWDPGTAPGERIVRGEPRAVPAMTLDTERCVPATIGVTALDVAGASDAARTGRFARRCDATADGLGRAIYLDPLEPPAAPGNVRVEYDVTRSSRCGFESDRCTIEVTWRDRSTNERSFSVFVGPMTRAEFEPCRGLTDTDCAEITDFECGSLRLAERVSADETSATVELRRSDHQAGRQRTNGLYCVVVLASNAAGDSSRVRTPHAMTVEWMY
jgi:hypothetical protein